MLDNSIQRRQLYQTLSLSMYICIVFMANSLASTFFRASEERLLRQSLDLQLPYSAAKRWIWGRGFKRFGGRGLHWGLSLGGFSAAGGFFAAAGPGAGEVGRLGDPEIAESVTGGPVQFEVVLIAHVESADESDRNGQSGLLPSRHPGPYIRDEFREGGLRNRFRALRGGVCLLALPGRLVRGSQHRFERSSHSLLHARNVDVTRDL